MTTARLRLVFLALAVALALPGALLVRRALASVALEREARERAVAERAFDELERALTEWLRSEEARPASDYEFSSDRSALREAPAESLAHGYFQIEASGEVSTPPWARGVAPLAAQIAAEGARMEIGLAEETTRPAAAKAFAATRNAAPPRPRPEAAKAVSPAPAPQQKDKREEIVVTAAKRDQDAPLPAPSEEVAAYDALSKLNTAAKEREQRTQQVYEEPRAVEEIVIDKRSSRFRREKKRAAPSSAAPMAEADANQKSAEQAVADAFAAEPQPESHEWDAGRVDRRPAALPGDPRAVTSEPAGVVGEASGAAQASAAATGAVSLAAAPIAAQEPADGQPADEEHADVVPAPEAETQPSAGNEAEETPRELRLIREAPVRVIVDPLRGRLLASGELLLVRTAWIGSRGVRQGLVLDLASVERSLGERILATGALPGAALRLAAAGNAFAAGAERERSAFAHRFAEPFDALAAELSFIPFADEGARSVYWLAALFALVVSGGLFAVYRMSAVALHFAERRSNFAAAVSHELKTPLTAIRLYAEMLRDGLVSGDEKRREYYGSITAETERLSRLINNVLEFSSLEKGARSLELRVGDAAPVVREAVELLRQHAHEHGLTLELAVDEALPPVRFERDALLQVVFNLIDNAVKYGRGEPARIEIGCRREGDGVALTVRDHGPGVPREELARILEPFYRRGDELTRSAPGAGIGLALVNSLAQQMGAALQVGNAEGGGFAATLQLSGANAG